MGEYRKTGGFGGGRSGGFSRGGGDRPRFGGSNDRKEMFRATCADCGNSCEVPFRPTGERPIYCRDCFPKNAPARDQGGRGDGGFKKSFGGDRGTFRKPSFTPRSAAPDTRGDDLARRMDAMNEKLDTLIRLMKPGAPTPQVKEAPAKEVKEARGMKKDEKPSLAKIVKKVAKKAAKSKKK